MAKKTLTKSSIEKKTFDYSIGDVNLNFTLRVDNSSQLKAFRECLIEAQKDIDEMLKMMKN